RAGWPPPPGGGLRAADLALTAGPGGWVAQVSAPGEGWRLSGDAAARSLDAALGRGRVRSSRFEVADVGGQVVVRGEGHGHGVGLCQAGASARARAGQGWRAILGAYFPGAAVAPLPWPPALEADAPR
ncbi:MAG: stage II sporulation protein SpoIID, partial [Anaeromyxobacteraceae bacterium]|nr:stage II sporulation protein SpoIID [Anaeromyxobacteraceae bacterium]